MPEMERERDAPAALPASVLSPAQRDRRRRFSNARPARADVKVTAEAGTAPKAAKTAVRLILDHSQRGQHSQHWTQPQFSLRKRSITQPHVILISLVEIFA
jgi:hypothetical protein